MKSSIAQYVKTAEESGRSFSEIVLESQAEEMGMSRGNVYLLMEKTFHEMKDALAQALKNDRMSVSGLTGKDGKKLLERIQNGQALGDGFLETVAARALCIAELNACMGRIVAAPTAGSCGILPAVLFTIMEHRGMEEDRGIMSLFTAAGVGKVIGENASISGAQGGCQAECGSAAAMAAAAAVELLGGTPEMCAHAAAISLKSILGLVCDPVAGLVEVPCIKRNATGAVNAITAAQMALAGIRSVIPADEVVWAMNNIGNQLPPSLKESAEGGLAITPTARGIEERLRDKSLDDILPGGEIEDIMETDG
ncbi:MAG: L-serine ammonia-lyase, iron-sulfur-dependent, subunit alpha [Clostridia bacterium]